MQVPNFLGQLKALQKDKANLNVLIPAGIGDLAWILAKLHGEAMRRGNMVFWVAQEEQQRAKQYADLVGIDLRYMNGLKTRWVWDHQGMPKLPKAGCVSVHANAHLERGNRLEAWYPELSLNYLQPDLTGFKDTHSSPFVLMFACTSNYMGGGQLSAETWRKMADDISEVAPARFIGAGIDVDFLSQIVGIRMCDLKNQHIGQVMAAMKSPLCCGVVGVASGVTILSTILGVRTWMFYPDHLAKMPGTFEPEGSRCGWSYLNAYNPALDGASERRLRENIGALRAVRSGAVTKFLKGMK